MISRPHAIWFYSKIFTSSLPLSCLPFLSPFVHHNPWLLCLFPSPHCLTVYQHLQVCRILQYLKLRGLKHLHKHLYLLPDQTNPKVKAYGSWTRPSEQSRPISRHDIMNAVLRVDQKSRHFRQATPVCRQDWCEIRLRQRRYPVHSRNAYFYPSKLEFSCRLCFSQLKSEILTTGEARHLSVATSSLHINDKIKGKGARRQEKKKKKNLIKLASVVRNPQTNSRHRTVILEAGFTQTYDIPVRDMKQWLLHSRDNVQLVVLADIKEDKKYILEQQKSDPSETMLLNFWKISVSAWKK